MSLLALLAREVHRHGLAALGGAFLVGVALAQVFEWELAREGTSLLRAAIRFVLFGLPLVPLVAIRRLVVLDRSDGGHAFVASMPVARCTIALVKWALSLVATLSAGLVVLAIGAGLALHYESLDPTRVLHLVWRVSAYLFAWHGITFGMAHLGRYRFRAWTLLVVVVTCGTLVPASKLGWFDVLERAGIELNDPPPWSSLPAALGWGLGGSAFGGLLAVVRGGRLVDALFEPTRTWRILPLVAAGVAFVAAGFTVVVADAPKVPSFGRLPNAGDRETVRAGGRARPIGEALSDDVPVVRAAVPACDWPVLAVVPSHASPPVLAELPSKSGILAHSVDPDRPEVSRRAVLTAALGSCGGSSLSQPTTFATLGAAAYLLDVADRDGTPDERDPVMERRAAYAARLGIGPADLADFPTVLRRVGPDVAEGIAWSGLWALHHASGPAATRAWIADDGRPFDEVTGLPFDEFTRQWAAALVRSRVAHPEVDALPLLIGDVTRESTPLAGTVLRWRWAATVVPDGVTLRWAALAPLRTVPDRWPEAQRFTVIETNGEVAVPVDEGEPVAAAFVAHVAELDGDLWSAWVVR